MFLKFTEWLAFESIFIFDELITKSKTLSYDRLIEIKTLLARAFH